MFVRHTFVLSAKRALSAKMVFCVLNGTPAQSFVALMYIHNYIPAGGGVTHKHLEQNFIDEVQKGGHDELMN